MGYYEYDPQQELRDAAREDAELELDLARAERVKLERQLAELQNQAPATTDAKVAQLATQLGRPVAEVQAEVAQIRAQGSAPTAPDPNKLSELLDRLDPNDLEGVNRAFDQAGYEREDLLGQRYRGGRLQWSGMQTQDIEAAYADIDQATSFEDLQERMARHGLIEGTA
jgi:hypothetical protein